MNEGVRCADTGETVFQAGGSARSNFGAFEEQQGGKGGGRVMHSGESGRK